MGETDPVVLLASGGLDSTTLAYWLKAQAIPFIPLFIDYGQHCADTELETLLDVIPSEMRGSVQAIRLSGVYSRSHSRLIVEPNLWIDNVDYEDLYLPYRSLLLLSVAAAYAQSQGIRRVFAGFINSNHAQEIDCSNEFFKKMSGVLGDYGGVEIEMPFREMNKLEVAKIGIRLLAPIGRTFSCQVSSKIPCGACPNCVDRLSALDHLAE